MNIVTRTRTEVYKHWIAALRSGKYKQTEGQLRYYEDWHRKPSFCCLGVLCDLASKDGGAEWVDSCFMDSYDVLPTKIRKWMKLSEYKEQYLMIMNDSGQSFSTIADYIEKNILPKIKD